MTKKKDPFLKVFDDIKPLPKGHYAQIDPSTYAALIKDLEGKAIIQLKLVPMRKVKKLYKFPKNTGLKKFLKIK